MNSEKTEGKSLGIGYTGSPKLISFLMILMLIFFAWILYKPIIKFHSNDEYPSLVPITPQQAINFGGTPSPVHVGMHVRDIPVFDIVQGTFTADITIWFRFDPRIISLDEIGRFSFDRSEIKYKSKPHTQIEGRKLFARYDMRIIFTDQLNYKNFPIDDHRINLSLTHYFLSPSDITFKSSESQLVIASGVDIEGWELIGKGVRTGFTRYDLDPNSEKNDVFHPRIVFSFDFARIGVRHIISIIFPLLLILFIAMFTLAFNPFGNRAGDILGISLASVTATIAHRFVIEGMSPPAGYFMISDYIFTLVLVNCCTIFLIGMFGTKIRSFYKNALAVFLTSIIIFTLVWLVGPLT